MADYSMSHADREAFLADTHVALLAVADDSRGPLLVPVWYWYRPGGEVHVVTGGASRKVKPCFARAKSPSRSSCCCMGG